jgi:hypothetical protein
VQFPRHQRVSGFSRSNTSDLRSPSRDLMSRRFSPKREKTVDRGNLCRSWSSLDVLISPLLSREKILWEREYSEGPDLMLGLLCRGSLPLVFSKFFDPELRDLPLFPSSLLKSRRVCTCFSFSWWTFSAIKGSN